MKAAVLLLMMSMVTSALSLDDSTHIESLNFDKAEVFADAENFVYHIELDQQGNDGEVLFADFTALKVKSGKDENITVVASGFSRTTGFRQLNSSHLAVTDYRAHCVKMVNREDDSISVIAGQCGNSGYADGKPGLLYFPWSVEVDPKDPGKLFITDRGNNALRSLNINSGAISTVVNSGFTFPRGMAWRGDRLLVANEHYVSEIFWSKNASTPTHSVLAGSSSTAGYVDGDFKLARFNNLFEIHTVTNDIFLVAEHNDRKLRLLDITRRQVLPVCINSVSSCNVSSDIDSPSSILKTIDAVYVGSAKKIIKLTGAHTVQRTPLLPVTTIRPACQDITISLPMKDGQSYVPVEITDGLTLTLGVGVHKYSKNNCSTTVIVEKETSGTIQSNSTAISKPDCLTRNISTILQDGETSARIEVSAGKWLKLGAGTYEYTDVSDGNCTIHIVVTETKVFRTTLAPKTTSLRPACVAKSIMITLEKEEKRASVEVTEGRFLLLGAGSYEYADVSEGNCTVHIRVVAHFTQSAQLCPPTITRIARQETGTAKIDLPLLGAGRKMDLPVGVFNFRLPSGSGVCDVNIVVIDPDLRRRLIFQADYDVTCDQAAAAVAKNIIYTIAQHHFNQIVELCQKHCKPISDKEPLIACQNGKLRVQWPTDLVYGGDVTKVKSDLQLAFTRRIAGKGTSFALTVLSKIPPVVSPVKNPDGSSVTFTLTSYCANKSTYNPTSGRCI